MTGRPNGFFAVTREPGEAWEAALSLREQAGWDEHAAFMDGLAEEGFIVLGGPLGDDGKTLLVVDAGNEEEIEARLAEDPWAPMRLLKVTKIERWRILLARPEDA